MSSSYSKGKILETILKYYLRQHGYSVIPENIQNYYNVKKEHHGLVVKGRGAWHQIDALGQFSFIVPFVYPIRLLAEARYRTPTPRKKTLSINMVRDFVGVVKDISENYVIDKPEELGYKKSFRFTDAGSIFATMPFSIIAQTYAYAHGIYLIPCSNLRNHVDQIYDKMQREPEFKRNFLRMQRSLNKGNYDGAENTINRDNQIYAYFGTVSGHYPIVITSSNELPINLFEAQDTRNVEIRYEYYQLSEEIRFLNHFIIKINNWEGIFELPLFMYIEYFQSKNFQREMIDLKEKIINFIDIPLIINGIKRIIRLQVDKDLLEEIKNSIEAQKRYENV
jgi:hypothetical protein